MNIKRFRTICRISSFVLKLLAVFSVIIVVYGLYTIYFDDGNFWFTYNKPTGAIYSMTKITDGAMITQADRRLAALIIVPFTLLVNFYTLFKGAQIFEWLGNGEAPFSEKFAKSLRRISLVLIISDLVIPIVHSLVLSFIYKGGYEIIIGIGSMFFIGIILYVISEIFYYGIELQHLANETV